MTKKGKQSARARRQAQQARRQRQRRLTIAFGAAGLLMIVALVAWVRQINAPKLEEVILPEVLETPANADGKSWGPIDAPVLIQEYSDFQ